MSATTTGPDPALVEARDLLTAARITVENPDAGLDDAWPRAAALLTRQALEQVIDAALAPRIPDLDGVSTRVKLACQTELTDPDSAHEAAWLWARLSTACHHHPYELAPTGAELAAWIDRVAALVAHATKPLPSSSGARTGLSDQRSSPAASVIGKAPQSVAAWTLDPGP